MFIAFHTGLREGEICALQWEDINLKDGYLTVNHNLVQKSSELVLEDPKTSASKDIVVLTKDLIKKLSSVYDEQKRLRMFTGIEFKYVCSWEDGRPLRPLYVTQTFTKYVKKFGFKKITFHGLRHTHASILFANGATSQEISKRLRHTRVATTDDIYIHLNKDIKKSTASIFDRAIEDIK